MANKTNQTTAPENQKTTAPENQKTTAPENQKTTAPENQKTTAPENQKTTAPENQGTEAPKVQEEELVPVYIPKTSRSDNERFVAVNGERILIQTGKTVQVPRRFAEVIQNSMASDAEAAAYIEANVSV